MENFTITFSLCLSISCFIWQSHQLRVTCWLYSKDLIFLPIGSKKLPWSIKTGLFRPASKYCISLRTFNCMVTPLSDSSPSLVAGLFFLIPDVKWMEIFDNRRENLGDKCGWKSLHTCLEPFLTLLAIIAAICMDVKVILNSLYWFKVILNSLYWFWSYIEQFILTLKLCGEERSQWTTGERTEGSNHCTPAQ